MLFSTPLAQPAHAPLSCRWAHPPSSVSFPLASSPSLQTCSTCFKKTVKQPAFPYLYPICLLPIISKAIERFISIPSTTGYHMTQIWALLNLPAQAKLNGDDLNYKSMEFSSGYILLSHSKIFDSAENSPSLY